MSDQTPRMSIDELKARLGDPELTIIDTRRASFLTSEKMIAGATREEPDMTDLWAPKYDPGRHYVTYCA